MMTKRWSIGFSAVAAIVVLSLVAAGSGAPAFLKIPAVALLTPVLGVVQAFTSPVSGFFDALGRTAAMAEENVALKTQLEKALSEATALREAGEENRQLRALLNFERDNPGREFLAGRIIANDPNGLIRSVVIDRGSEQGVQKGMVVVVDRGMVGRVVVVYPRAARVLLTTDASSVVNGVVQRSRVQGVATGRADGSLALQYVDKDADVKEGDVVVSSGLGGGYPRGITLGTVKRVTNADQAFFKEVQLTPAATSGPLEIALVMLDFVPGELP